MSKLIFFDIDNTLTEDNSWERLNLAAGITSEEDYRLYKAFHSDEISYSEWTTTLQTYYQERNILTEKMAVSALTGYTIRENALYTIQSLKAQDITVVLLTGGFRTTAKHLSRELGISNYLYVTDITFDTDGYFQQLVSKGEEGEAKLQLARDYCNSHSYKLENAIAVGDSTNDIPLFSVVKRSFTFSWCKDEVKNTATDIIEKLSEIPDMLKNT